MQFLRKAGRRTRPWRTFAQPPRALLQLYRYRKLYFLYPAPTSSALALFRPFGNLLENALKTQRPIAPLFHQFLALVN